ncbi:MAG: ribonuclease HII [Clostridia bacterium]|nr:ribonuclease HII [Clostridia bacterium]
MTSELFEFDKKYSCVVAGMDEAGRGPLAGPVVCACCIMPLDDMIDGINDSKRLSEKQREILFGQIISKAKCYGIGIVEHDVIDEINILQATKRGMREAYANMGAKPNILLIDAVKLDLDVKVESLIKGDARSYNIAAASIIAKVTRDRIMRDYDKQFPAYGFSSNKGYGTKIHVEALKTVGSCPIHRRTFIKNFGDGL